jgi:hypothetical protein
MFYFPLIVSQQQNKYLWEPYIITQADIIIVVCKLREEN